MPFACLLDAQCQPLIEKFVDRSISETEAFQNGRVDLYIPAPWTANRLQSYLYHLAIRNLFAWMFRRSVVGEHLGQTLISLANCLQKYREPGADNMQDMMAYLDEEGYLDVRDQPTHALALLHLAETYEMGDLYLEAFAHCVGMSERLNKHNEYSVSADPPVPVPTGFCLLGVSMPSSELTAFLQRISSASRKLIRHARVDMDFRLSRAGAMLSDLLREEFSEAHLGLSAAERDHLNRFRTYVHGFYATRLGSWPPRASDQKCRTIFKPEVYRLMSADFGALYEYLVDKDYTIDGRSHTAQGGLCTLQLVHEFDCRHKFASLPHPLPLLPQPVKNADSRKRRSISWLMGGPNSKDAKGRPNQHLLSYASLMKATNHSQVEVLKNRLVVAYRQFEEESLATLHKAEFTERISFGPADARKVRWLFIYAVYQTLLSCAETPGKVHSNNDLAYHLNVSTPVVLPWGVESDLFDLSGLDGQDTAKSLPSKARPAEQQRKRTVSPIPLLPPTSAPTEAEKHFNGLDIKPDIDYHALTHAKPPPPPPKDDDSGAHGAGGDRPGGIQRSISLTKSMSLRMPLSRFRSTSSNKSRELTTESVKSLSRKHIYHEIMVHGYGNGTHEVSDASSDASSSRTHGTQPNSPKLSVSTASRSHSTSSNSSYQSAHSRSSAHSKSSTRSCGVPSDFSSTPTSPLSNTWKQQETNESIADSSTLYEQSLGGKPSYTDLKQLQINTNVNNLENHPAVAIPPRSSSQRKTIRSMYSNDDMLAASSVNAPPPLPRKSSKRLTRTTSVSVTASASASASADAKQQKRWSMVEISAALRVASDSDPSSSSSTDDSASDYGSDVQSDGSVLHPRPLRIQKVATPVEPKHPASPIPVSPMAEKQAAAAEAAEAEDVLTSLPVSPMSSSAAATDVWEQSLRSGMIPPAPPCAWEQFYDLGGLQPMHLLK